MVGEGHTEFTPSRNEEFHSKAVKTKAKRAFPHQGSPTQVGQGLLVDETLEERLGRVLVWVD